MNYMKVKSDKIFASYDDLAKANGILPVKVTDFYNKKVQQEIENIGIEGPLYRCAFPTKERIGLHVAGEVPDFVCDQNNMPNDLGNCLIQKYEDRVLILLSEQCFGHCQYCFRTQLLSVEQQDKRHQQAKIDVGKIVAYLKNHHKVKEIIFSGGDPLLLGPDKLEMILKDISNGVGKINFRIHTRSLVYSPDIYSENLCLLFKRFQVRLVFHISHPYEICEKVEEKIRFINSFGIRMYNQFPILRKINDHEKVLSKLLEKLDELNIRQLSIFIPDPISFSASFRMPLERIFSIVDRLSFNYPAWINSFRLVLDTPIGKVRREQIASWNRKTGVVVFKRGKKTVSYRDFSEEFDSPGRINKLLWKEKNYEKKH